MWGAAAPAISLDVVKMLQTAGLALTPDPTFNPNRAPIIRPKKGWTGLKLAKTMGELEKVEMSKRVVCKCEKVTELEVVDALRRSLPIDSTQAIRKRTRAGMGHCQADPNNYCCEDRVAAIIARENQIALTQVSFPSLSLYICIYISIWID